MMESDSSYTYKVSERDGNVTIAGNQSIKRQRGTNIQIYFQCL